MRTPLFFSLFWTFFLLNTKIIRIFAPFVIKLFMSQVKSWVLAACASLFSLSCLAQKVQYQIDSQTDRINHLSVVGDKSSMNWLVQTDGTQYRWIDSQFQWGAVANLDGSPVAGLKVKVTRKQEGDDLVETYVLQNAGKKAIDLSTVQIYTPWNDNYPDAFTCLNKRCHAHIWAGDRAAYTYALRMNGEGPHLGIMIEEGSIVNYAINQRGTDKEGCNTRGIIGLIPEKFTLLPGRFYVLRWRVFAHQGEEDFFKKMVDKGGIRVKADRYTAVLGDTINIEIISKTQTTKQSYAVQQTGDIRVPLSFAKGKPTHLEAVGVLGLDRLIDARANFIFEHQQIKEEYNPLYGAYLPFDRASNSIVLNQDNIEGRVDVNEGRERLGMGVFMAYFAAYVNQHPNSTYMNRRHLGVSLQLYSDFLHKLQNSSYKTWGTINHTDDHRLYNYPWVAHFYAQMFEVTHKKQFLIDAYRTQRAQYENGGYELYAIGVPARKLITLMRENRMTAEADTLLSDFIKVADFYVRNNFDYPKTEVNFGQSIVAPCVEFLCEMYLLTQNADYLSAVHRMMPVLEAFNGHQPSSHLNDIAILHSEGYRMGLPQVWGDVLPHHLTCITAQAFALFSEITGDSTYRERAKGILLANLVNFDSQGHGFATFHYPAYVDGKAAHFANPCSNDQDWSLAYLLQLRDIIE